MLILFLTIISSAVLTSFSALKLLLGLHMNETAEPNIASDIQYNTVIKSSYIYCWVENSNEPRVKAAHFSSSHSWGAKRYLPEAHSVTRCEEIAGRTRGDAMSDCSSEVRLQHEQRGWAGEAGARERRNTCSAGGMTREAAPGRKVSCSNESKNQKWIERSIHKIITSSQIHNFCHKGRRPDVTV